MPETVYTQVEVPVVHDLGETDIYQFNVVKPVPEASANPEKPQSPFLIVVDDKYKPVSPSELSEVEFQATKSGQVIMSSPQLIDKVFLGFPNLKELNEVKGKTWVKIKNSTREYWGLNQGKLASTYLHDATNRADLQLLRIF